MFKKRFKKVFMKRLSKEVQTVYERAVIRINALLDMDACILHGADVYGDTVMVLADTVEPVVSAVDMPSVNSDCIAFRVELRNKYANVYASVCIPELYMKNATRKICVMDAEQLCYNYIEGISDAIAQKYIEEREKNHD